MFNRRTTKFLAAVAALLVLSTIAYAFAAGITVPPSNAGYGPGVISGYEVTGIAYTLATDPTDLDSVGLTLDTSATAVQISVDGTNWITCGGSGTSWTCDLSTSGITVFSAANLEVVAYTNVIP